MSTIGALEWSVPSGATSTAVAATASWPSRKTVARTGNASPTTALAGNRPASATGETSTTGMRPIGAGCGGATEGRGRAARSAAAGAAAAMARPRSRSRRRARGRAGSTDSAARFALRDDGSTRAVARACSSGDVAATAVAGDDDAAGGRRTGLSPANRGDAVGVAGLGAAGWRRPFERWPRPGLAGGVVTVPNLSAGAPPSICNASRTLDVALASGRAVGAVREGGGEGATGGPAREQAAAEERALERAVAVHAAAAEAGRLAHRPQARAGRRRRRAARGPRGRCAGRRASCG